MKHTTNFRPIFPTEADIRERRIVEQAKAAIAMQAPGASAFQKAAEATKAHSKNTARRVL